MTHFSQISEFITYFSKNFLMFFSILQWRCLTMLNSYRVTHWERTYTLESVPAIPHTTQLVATSFIWWNVRWFADSLIIWPFLGQSAQFHSISGHFFVWDPRVFEAEMGVLCAVWRVSEIRGAEMSTSSTPNLTSTETTKFEDILSISLFNKVM